MLIDLPQLTGAHSGKHLAEVISVTLAEFSIIVVNVGYFVLDNAGNNDTTVATLALSFNFDLVYRRLCYSPYTLNLIS
jgi:hypothetical protein